MSNQGEPDRIRSDATGIEAMTRASLLAHAAIMEHGSPELQALARLLLFVLARETAARTMAGDRLVLRSAKPESYV